MGWGMSEDSQSAGEKDDRAGAFVSKIVSSEESKLRTTIDAKARRLIPNDVDESSSSFSPRILPPSEQEEVQYPFITKTTESNTEKI